MKLFRPRSLGLLVPLFSAVLALTGCHRKSLVFSKAPVIVISIDTLRADHLPLYGYRSVETPAIDALARDSIRPALDAVVSYLPAPTDLPPVHGVNPRDTSEKLERVQKVLVAPALGYTSPQNVALVAATSPILTQLLRWILDGVRPHPAILALAGTALAGLVLVITRGHLGGFGAFGPGDLLALGAALGWSLYTYGAGTFPGWSPLRYTTLTMIGGAAVTIAVTVLADVTGLAHLPTLTAVRAITPHLVYVAVIGSVVAALGVFVPAFAVVLVAVPLMNRFKHLSWMRNFLAGVNASVVGA